MTPETIIQQATAEGVRLALSETGTLKATGEQEVINRWLPTIQAQKAGIVKALLEASALSGDLPAIRAWLRFIGEHDPLILNDVLTRCRNDPETLAYFSQRAQ